MSSEKQIRAWTIAMVRKIHNQRSWTDQAWARFTEFAREVEIDRSNCAIVRSARSDAEKSPEIATKTLGENI